MHEIINHEVVTKGKLSFEGSLIIQEANTIKESLINSLSQVTHLTINHENVDSFDLSYLQTLIAVHKSAIAQHKIIEVEGKHPDGFIRLLKNSGLPGFTWMSVPDIDENGKGGEDNG